MFNVVIEMLNPESVDRSAEQVDELGWVSRSNTRT
jgi:hypothetical protein